MTLFFGLGQAAGPSVAGAIADATGLVQLRLSAGGGRGLSGWFGLAAAPATPGSRRVRVTMREKGALTDAKRCWYDGVVPSW